MIFRELKGHIKKTNTIQLHKNLDKKKQSAVDLIPTI